mgnify:CR=1 FL=1
MNAKLIAHVDSIGDAVDHLLVYDSENMQTRIGRCDEDFASTAEAFIATMRPAMNIESTHCQDKICDELSFTFGDKYYWHIILGASDTVWLAEACSDNIQLGLLQNKLRSAAKAFEKEFDSQQPKPTAQNGTPERTDKEQIAHHNSGLHSAKRRQATLLPDLNALTAQSRVKEIACYYEPKDVVGGDFYLYHTYENKTAILLADCVGHGMEGALVTMMGVTILRQLLPIHKDEPAHEILRKLYTRLKSHLHTQSSVEEASMSMDVGLVILDPSSSSLDFVGTGIRLLVSDNDNNLSTIRGMTEVQKLDGEYFTERLPYDEGTTLAMYTDGFNDQFGGEKNRKFTRKRIDNHFAQIAEKPLAPAINDLTDELEDWMKNTEQTDDITLVAFRP